MTPDIKLSPRLSIPPTTALSILGVGGALWLFGTDSGRRFLGRTLSDATVGTVGGIAGGFVEGVREQVDELLAPDEPIVTPIPAEQVYDNPRNLQRLEGRIVAPAPGEVLNRGLSRTSIPFLVEVSNFGEARQVEIELLTDELGSDARRESLGKFSLARGRGVRVATGVPTSSILSIVPGVLRPALGVSARLLANGFVLDVRRFTLGI